MTEQQLLEEDFTQEQKDILREWTKIYHNFKVDVNALIEKAGGSEKLAITVNNEEDIVDRLMIGFK